MREFDDILRDKLDSLAARSNATPDWEDMNARLDGEAFDDVLRQGLGASGAAVPRWDMLAERLDAEAAVEGDAFDQLLASKLNRAARTTDAPTASWRKLSHRMDTLWPLRRKLVRYRVLEFAAAASLVLTFLPLLQDNPSRQPTRRAPVTAAVDGDAQQNYSGSEDASSMVLPKGGLFADADELASNQGGGDYATIPTPLAALQSAFDWVVGSGNELPQLAVPGTTPLNSGVAVIAGTKLRDTQNTVSSSNQSSTDTQAQRGALGDAAVSVESVSLARVRSNQSPTLAALPAVASIAKPRRWRIGIEGGSRMWQIYTPADAKFQLSARSAREAGVGANVSVARALGSRAELSTGLGLAVIDYDPDFPTLLLEGDGSAGGDQLESFAGVEVRVAQLPLDIRFDVLANSEGHGRTRLWAKAGIAANVILDSDYGIVKETGDFQSLSMVSNPSNAGGKVSPPGTQSTETLLSNERDITPGFFDKDGELAENTFFSGRLGLEAEVLLGERFSVYGGLDYNRFLSVTDGLGPTSDELSTLGLSIGVRVSL